MNRNNFVIILHHFYFYFFTEMWNISFNSSGTLSLVRNLCWEGYCFYAGVATSEFGGAYFGNGVKNSDLAFMF